MKTKFEFDTITYLKGRKEYLRAQTKIQEQGSSSERCAQARLTEVCELLTILEKTNGSN